MKGLFYKKAYQQFHI